VLIYDFFAGTGSATRAFEDAGHTVIKVELDEFFPAHERDVMGLTAEYMVGKYGKPDFIWASPPCTTFSVASIGRHWNLDRTPKNEKALAGMRMVQKTVELIQAISPSWWVIENPRGMLRKLDLIPGIRHTIAYCQYGDTRMKPTDLWTNIQHWQPRPMCKPKATCHQAAPRGSQTGTQGLKNAKIKSMIPYEVGQEILDVIG
jgi:hypothetical protein